MASHTFWKNMKENNPALPERLGEPWSDEEDGKVLELIQEEYTSEQIAHELKRTNGSIKARLRHLAVEMSKKNISVENIGKLTTLSHDDISKCVQKYNEEQLNKKRKKEELVSVPYADLMEIKLILHEIRDIIRNAINK
jgi:predicted transcriptional regulator